MKASCNVLQGFPSTFDGRREAPLGPEALAAAIGRRALGYASAAASGVFSAVQYALVTLGRRATVGAHPPADAPADEPPKPPSPGGKAAAADADDAQPPLKFVDEALSGKPFRPVGHVVGLGVAAATVVPDIDAPVAPSRCRYACYHFEHNWVVVA